MQDIELEIVKAAFPNELNDEVESVFSMFKIGKLGSHTSYEEIRINNCYIRLPARVYFDELGPNQLAALNEREYKVLCCYFTRHHNGYIREKYLRQLLSHTYLYDWELPFICALIGEYVVEILDVIYENWNFINKSGMNSFIEDNPKYITTIEGRIASYWGEYYMSGYPKKEYVGFKLKKELRILRKGTNQVADH